MFNRYLSRTIGSSPDGLLWSPDPGTGTAGGSEPPAGGSPAAVTPPPSSATPPPAGGTPPPAGGTPPASQFTYAEDRSAWVPPDKYKKAEQLTNRTAGELEKLRNDLKERDKRIAALAGITTPTAEQTEAEQVAAAFYSLPQFAHLKGITPELLERVTRLADQSETLTEARDHVYNQQADRFLASLDTKFADEIGAQSLTEGQSKKLRAAFGASMPDAKADPEAFAAFKKRYDSGDESLIDDFVKEFASDLLEPARRQATIPIAQRRPVPRGGPSAAVVQNKQKPDYSKMSVSEMLDAAEKEAESLGR